MMLRDLYDFVYIFSGLFLLPLNYAGDSTNCSELLGRYTIPIEFTSLAFMPL